MTKKKFPKQRKIARPVEIFDYDRKWPSKFLDERTKIMGVIGDSVVEVEHVGSTAVPGLCAKPIIDIMVGIRKLIDAENCIVPLESIEATNTCVSMKSRSRNAGISGKGLRKCPTSTFIYTCSSMEATLGNATCSSEII